MILEELRLRNIRSYEDESIRFRKGSTLLSGDIGSGKTTVLIAVEFALFGLMRGMFSGETLLRNGTDIGEVELFFSVDNKKVNIKRAIKRTKNGIQQASGYVVIDGQKKEGTAIELKAEILNLLGYPQQLLSKSKGLVYRYTVYTPQEDMKQIITEDKETRLDILRKVFGIEKYKNIRTNCTILSRRIKEKIKEYEGKAYDIEPKKKELSEKEKKLTETEKQIEELSPILERKKALLLDFKESIKQIEDQKKQYNLLVNEYNLQQNRIANFIDQRTRLINEKESLIKDVEELNKEIPDHFSGKEEIEKEISEKKKQKYEAEKQIIEMERKISEFKGLIGASNSVITKIRDLEKCPTCEQEVTEEHKKGISEREQKKISEQLKQIESVKIKLTETERLKIDLTKKIDLLQNSVSKILQITEKKKRHDEKLARLKKVEEEVDSIKLKIGESNKSKLELTSKIDQMKDIEKGYDDIKTKYDEALEDYHSLDNKMKVLINEKSNTIKIFEGLRKEVKEKESSLEKVKKGKKIISWLENEFSVLMETIETKVMSTIFFEFNTVFTRWFNVLIEDENINARLSREFVPIIEQNGYEINVENLSGGERTSCALSYRLALNKVINDVINSIKTKDIIILDEPTEGFSTEQLDKMRELLDIINIKQTIIVSHESKIESFVENIVRITKEHNVSKAIPSY